MRRISFYEPKHCLTIAGSDCSGGAGIQADIKTFSALGCFGMSVITSVVAESPKRVISRKDMTEEMVWSQLEAVFRDMDADAVKTGMLPGKGAINAAVRAFKRYYPRVVVCDPVMVATSGGELMDKRAKELYIEKLLPLCTLITPNIIEAEELTGIKIKDKDGMKEAAKKLTEMGAKNALVKGGHLEEERAVDIFYDGKEFAEFSEKRIRTNALHGTGCTLSAAVTAYSALGCQLKEAIEKAKEYVTGTISNNFEDMGCLNHFYKGVIE